MPKYYIIIKELSLSKSMPDYQDSMRLNEKMPWKCCEHVVYLMGPGGKSGLKAESAG